MEFKICPNNDVTGAATQLCLDKHVLPLAAAPSGSVQTRYILPDGSGVGWYTVAVKLPDDLICQQCVLQWKYHTGR